MPAVTSDTIALPRVARPGLDAAERRVISVTTAPSGLEGEGFPVRRAFAGVDLATLDPFVHMDQMGEVDYGPGEPKGTPWHPHRGFETVTYLIDGVMRHQDSNGGGGLITNGDTQWMTAGGGILHIEAPPEDPGARHRVAGRAGPPALAGRLQRAGLRAGGRGHGGRGPPPGPHRPAGRLGLRRVDHLRGRRHDG